MIQLNNVKKKKAQITALASLSPPLDPIEFTEKSRDANRDANKGGPCPQMEIKQCLK